LNFLRTKYGFTLIEVIVVVAIVAIMTGMMIPMVYRVWESNEEDLTRQRMRDLKVALVGDSRLIQSGSRYHFGYVGDLGQLPATLGHLLQNLDSNPSWQGPYLPSGYNADKYDKDAWGNIIVYDPTPSGQYAAFLTSKGPNGILSDSDDISEATDKDLQIYLSEVAPLATIQGNLNILFQSPPSAAKSYYIRVAVRHKAWSASELLPSIGCCSGILSTSTNTGNAQVNYTHSFICPVSGTVPEGTATLAPVLYVNDSACTSSPTGTGSEVLVNASSSSLFTNLQIQSIAP